MQIVRRFFRRIMKPMSIEEAEAKKSFFAKAYFLFSFGAFSTILYQVKQGRFNWLEAEGLIPEDETKLSPAFQYARMLGVKNATVIRVKGTDIMSSKEYDKETFDVSKHIEEEENSLVDPEKKFLNI
ncbi:uncharacterized protein LOC112686996 isoform X2 [Sipha flava]|nr:uncharacterized protein LOC112686996 isoform X2 [Sipha flava]